MFFLSVFLGKDYVSLLHCVPWKHKLRSIGPSRHSSKYSPGTSGPLKWSCKIKSMVKKGFEENTKGSEKSYNKYHVPLCLNCLIIVPFLCYQNQHANKCTLWIVYVSHSFPSDRWGNWTKERSSYKFCLNVMFKLKRNI